MALRDIKRVSQNAFSGREHPLETLRVSHVLTVSPGAPLGLSPMWRDTKGKTVSPFGLLLVLKRQNYSIQEGPIIVQQRFADPFGTTQIRPLIMKERWLYKDIESTRITSR